MMKKIINTIAILLSILCFNACKSRIDYSNSDEGIENNITEAEDEAIQEYIPSKIEWLLLQATVYATPENLFHEEFKKTISRNFNLSQMG